MNCEILAAVCFQKLPHPLSGVLQKISVVDGIDEDGLLVFLDLVLQLADFPGVSDGEVLSLIYPYYRGSFWQGWSPTLCVGAALSTLFMGKCWISSYLSLIHI